MTSSQSLSQPQMQQQELFYANWLADIINTITNYRIQQHAIKEKRVVDPYTHLSDIAQQHKIRLDVIPIETALDLLKNVDDPVIRLAQTEWQAFRNICWQGNSKEFDTWNRLTQGSYFNNYMSRLTISDLFDETRNEHWVTMRTNYRFRALRPKSSIHHNHHLEEREQQLLEEAKEAQQAAKRDGQKTRTLLEAWLYRINSMLIQKRDWEQNDIKLQNSEQRYNSMKETLKNVVIGTQTSSVTRLVPCLQEEEFKEAIKERKKKWLEVVTDATSKGDLITRVKAVEAECKKRTHTYLEEFSGYFNMTTEDRNQYFAFNDSLFLSERYEVLHKMIHMFLQYLNPITDSFPDIVNPLKERWRSALEEVKTEEKKWEEKEEEVRETVHEKRQNRYRLVMEIDIMRKATETASDILESIDGASSVNYKTTAVNIVNRNSDRFTLSQDMRTSKINFDLENQLNSQHSETLLEHRKNIINRLTQLDTDLTELRLSAREKIHIAKFDEQKYFEAVAIPQFEDLTTIVTPSQHERFRDNAIKLMCPVATKLLNIQGRSPTMTEKNIQSLYAQVKKIKETKNARNLKFYLSLMPLVMELYILQFIN
jgi:hypothetical protein